MVDLPANVRFGPNLDGYVVDQQSDVINSVQAFKNGDAFIIEIWGKTTLVTPSGERLEGRMFQQVATIEFNANHGFGWSVIRWVGEHASSLGDATEFQVSGLEDDVPKYRQV